MTRWPLRRTGLKGSHHSRGTYALTLLCWTLGQLITMRAPSPAWGRLDLKVAWGDRKPGTRPHVATLTEQTGIGGPVTDSVSHPPPKSPCLVVPLPWAAQKDPSPCSGWPASPPSSAAPALSTQPACATRRPQQAISQPCRRPTDQFTTTSRYRHRMTHVHNVTVQLSSHAGESECVVDLRAPTSRRTNTFLSLHSWPSLSDGASCAGSSDSSWLSAPDFCAHAEYVRAWTRAGPKTRCALTCF